MNCEDRRSKVVGEKKFVEDTPKFQATNRLLLKKCRQGQTFLLPCFFKTGNKQLNSI
jgi:hypothetical protein